MPSGSESQAAGGPGGDRGRRGFAGIGRARPASGRSRRNAGEGYEGFASASSSRIDLPDRARRKAGGASRDCGLIEEVKKRAPGRHHHSARSQHEQGTISTRWRRRLPAAARSSIAAYVTVSAYRGNVALAGNYPDFVNSLIAGKVPVMLVALGNPYLVRSFPNAAAYLTTYSPTPTSETALAKALFGEIAITGQLPVTIPGVAKYGDGIQVPIGRPRRARALKMVEITWLGHATFQFRLDSGEVIVHGSLGGRKSQLSQGTQVRPRRRDPGLARALRSHPRRQFRWPRSSSRR